MSLITAYFKKETASVDVTLPELSSSIVDAKEIKCTDPVHHSVNLLHNEDSNMASPSPPKRMKIALFAPHESPASTSDCIRNQEVEQYNKLQEDEAMTTCKEPVITDVNPNDGKLHEQTTARQLKTQSRQTILKFESGKCILVPIEQNVEMDAGSQESSQIDTEDDCSVKNQERKKKKKSKRKCFIEDDCVEEIEPPANKRKSRRKAAKEASKQLSGLLHEPLPPGSSSLSKLTSEDNQVKLIPEIVVEDSEAVEETLATLDNKSNDAIDVIAKEEIIVESSSPARVAMEMTGDDSSDSDVICLTPRSQSPLPHNTGQQPPSQPSTPAKNKWSHIFGTKSPQKKSSPRSSPIRKSSPRKRSPRRSTPVKQVSVMPSSLATSCEQYTLGVPLFYHVMQQSNSTLWSLPKVELSSMNAHQLRSSHPQSIYLTSEASCDLCKGHQNKKLINLDSIQRKPLHLAFLNPNEKNDVLDGLNIKHASLLCNHFTLLNQQLSAERSRLLAEWASWEEQVRLVQAENEKIEKEVVEVPEDPPLELVVSIRFLRTDIASELVTVDSGWYSKQQKNSQATYNLRCRRQQQNWKEAFRNSDTDNDDPYGKSSQLQKRKLKKRKKRLSCFASDDENSSWSDEECEKKEIAINSNSLNSAPKKMKVLMKPTPGPPNFKPLNDQWVDLYAPRQPDHIFGNDAPIQALCQWLTQWKEGRGGSYNKLQQRKAQGQSNCITLDDDSDAEEEEGTSTVLLVRGPVGCGKTSAINACANKLGYKVFELNSSTRRSGSQVISILQEATQSHQITTQLKATKQPTSSQDDDENESNDTQDIKPSRTITSFFKPIGGGKTNKDGGVVQSNSCKGAVEDDHFKLALASHTVILIEEVDILFEDDKGFWSAIYDIIASSKRPIICTCNDHCLVLQCRHDTIDMCRPKVHEVSDHIQIIASSHDLCIPAGVACTLTAMLGCDTRRVIHTLHYALCHASVALKNVESSVHDIVPAGQPVSVIEQLLMEAKCGLFSDIFLTNLVHQLETVSNCAKKLQSRLQRPWRNCGGILRTSQSKHSYDQLDTLSNACDWLSHRDIIGDGEESSALDPNNAHCWWDVTEQSCLLDTAQQLSGELEVEKIRKQQDEIAVCIEHLTEQIFSFTDNSSTIEELVLRATETCRRREKFNSDMLAVVQNEFTNHYQLQHSAMATDFLPYMHIICEAEEARKGRQRRFRHYLLARGVSDVTISSLLHHQKLLT